MSSDTTYGHCVVHGETGVWIQLRSGTIISIQWKDTAMAGTHTVETAVWNQGRAEKNKWDLLGDWEMEVNSYQSGDQVAAFISAVAAVDEAKENTNHE